MKITKKQLKNMIREEIESMNEVDFEKTQVPASVKRFMGRFVDSLKGANLNKIRQVAILGQVIKALGISSREFASYMQKIKRGL